jgi:RNA polymerase sigma-70 factor, ECF subfamily
MDQENKYIRSLIDNARRGKIVAQEELYEMHLVGVYTLIIRLTGDKALAELFTKRTLVIAWKEINKKAPENVSYKDWLNNIAIKTTSSGFLGSNANKEKINRSLSTTDDQSAAFSTNPLDIAIAELDDVSRAIFVLNKIHDYPLDSFLGLIGVHKSEAAGKLSDSVSKISRSLSSFDAEVGLDTLVESLPREIQPDENLLDSALDEINEIRFKELKEKEADTEDLEELIEIEKKRKAALKKKKRVEKIVHKKGKVQKPRDKIVFGILILTAIVSFAFYFITSTNEWKISLVSGSPLKNKLPIVKMEEFIPGDIIFTDEVSSASIDIAEIGTIKILSNTYFERLDNDNNGELIKGKLKVNTVVAKENLQIAIPRATIENIYFGTKYSLKVDSKNNSLIVLKKGWLRVNSGNDEIIFPQKYSLKIISGKGASLPYYSKSGLYLVTLFEEYLFNGKKNITLNKIIESSTGNETIVLWNLLQRVKPDQRAVVYDKLYKLVPHSDDITKKDILSLDQNILQIWLDEIKWYL